MPDMQISRLPTQVKDLVQQQLHSKCSRHLFQGLLQAETELSGAAAKCSRERKGHGPDTSLPAAEPWEAAGSQSSCQNPKGALVPLTCCRNPSWQGMALGILWWAWWEQKQKAWPLLPGLAHSPFPYLLSHQNSIVYYSVDKFGKSTGFFKFWGFFHR